MPPDAIHERLCPRARGQPPRRAPPFGVARQVARATTFLLDAVEALRVSHTAAFRMFGKGLLPNKDGGTRVPLGQGHGYDVEPQRARFIA